MGTTPVGIELGETMRGFLAPGAADFQHGYEEGRRQGLAFTLRVKITVPDIDAFINLTERSGLLEGTIDYTPLGEDLKIEDGVFQLYTLVPTGERRLVYRFRFAGRGGVYFYDGYKRIVDDPLRFDLVEDMTHLFSRIYRLPPGSRRAQAPPGLGEHPAPVDARFPEGPELFAAGIVRFDPLDGPDLFRSLRAVNAPDRVEALRARVRLMSFVYRELRNEYLQRLSPLYWTGYENLVLSGRCAGGARAAGFFLFSGAHDLGFPWGDGATFWDVVLVLEGPDGTRERYLAADLTLEGLRLNIDGGVYRYTGDLFRLTRGHRVSFLDDLRRADPILEQTWGCFDLRFKARPFSRQRLLFPFKEHCETGAADHLRRRIESWLPHLNGLGVNVRPHRLTLASGTLQIGKGAAARTWVLDPASTFGEAETARFTLVKEPTLRYHYQCGVNAAARRAHVRIEAGVWRDDRHLPLKDGIDRLLAPMVDMAASREWLIDGEGFSSGPPGSEPAIRVTDPDVLEINYEHYPTAVFQRRVVEMTDRTGMRFLALEEAMDHLNCASLNSNARRPVVSRTRTGDAGSDGGAREKIALLDRVVAESGFLDHLEQSYLASGKARPDFLVAVKPNFMFLHHRRDVTTYTDPALVERLVDHIRGRGFTNLVVAEAQNTYGEFFHHRDTVGTARYIGLETGPRYRVVDLSEDLVEHEYGPPLHRGWVNPEWRDADYRVSFAKNKTHVYAYYTLNLKNIFGALPMANKFREYHARREVGIYESTIEYLAHFPIHFGFIDAYYSADGPFGVFADRTPVPTRTILGGPDIVAVDWVAAARMGLNPLFSKYMQCAVARFGKPRIDVLGDREIYEPWRNVPLAMILGSDALDRNYRFGFVFYAVFAEQDPAAFPPRDLGWRIRVLRVLTKPIRKMVFGRGVLDEKAMRKIRRLVDAVGLDLTRRH